MASNAASKSSSFRIGSGITLSCRPGAAVFDLLEPKRHGTVANVPEDGDAVQIWNRFPEELQTFRGEFSG
jgi:hypothetical protein